jgi:hypothetical protein
MPGNAKIAETGEIANPGAIVPENRPPTSTQREITQ